MAKICVDCHKKVGFLSGYHENEDGSYTCDICFDKQKKEKEMDEAIKKLWNCNGGGKGWFTLNARHAVGVYLFLARKMKILLRAEETVK